MVILIDMLSIVGFLFVTRIVSISGMNNTIDIYLLFIGNNQSHHHQVNNENGAELAVEESGRNSSSSGDESNNTFNAVHSLLLNGSFPIELNWIQSTCHILLVFTGVPLNLFIAIIIMTFKRLHNKPRNVLWLGVTFFNLLTLLTILIELLAYHTQNSVVCLIFVSTTGVAFTSILFNLLLALIDRYTAIVHPIWHRQNVTVRWVITGQSVGFFLIVFVIKFPFIAQFAPPYCGYYPVHAKLIAVTNLLLFVSCILAEMIVYMKTRQYFKSNRQRGADGSEATVTFVLSAMRRNNMANSSSSPSGSQQQSRHPSSDAAVAVNIDSPSSAAGGGHQQQQLMLRRHHIGGGNRQMELEATWSLLCGVFSLLLFTFPTLVVGFIEWGCRIIYGEGHCTPFIGFIIIYTRELLLGHLVYNPIMYMLRNREFSSTVREKIRF